MDPARSCREQALTDRHPIGTFCPVEVRLATAGAALKIEWDDGQHTRLAAGYLRAKCRSAGALRMKMEDAGESVGVRITDVQAVGNYGLHLAFSDGQNRGIYPWAYLRQLASTSDPADCEAQ